MSIIEALRNYSAALRVSGTDEAADRAWAEFLADMDADVRALVGRDDRKWLTEAMRHCYDVGYRQGLAKASELAAKALEGAV